MRVLTYVAVLFLTSVAVLLAGVASGVMVGSGESHVSFDVGLRGVPGYAFLVRGSRVYVDVNLLGSNVSGSLTVTFRDLASGRTWSWSARIVPGAGVVGPVFIVPRTGFYSFAISVKGSTSVSASVMVTCVPGPDFRVSILHRVLWGSLPVLFCGLLVALIGLVLKLFRFRWSFAELTSWEVTSSFKAYGALACAVFTLLSFIRVGNYFTSSLGIPGSVYYGTEYLLLTLTLRALSFGKNAFALTCIVFAVGVTVLTFNQDVESGSYKLYLSLGFGRGKLLAAKALAATLVASSPLTALYVTSATLILGWSWVDTRFLAASVHALLVFLLLLSALMALAFLGAVLPLKSVYSLIVALLVGLAGLSMLGAPSVEDLMLALIADPSLRGLASVLTPYVTLLAAVLAGLTVRYYLMDYG